MRRRAQAPPRPRQRTALTAVPAPQARPLEEHIDLPSRAMFWSCVLGLALVSPVGAQRWTDSEYKVASDGTVSVRSGNLKAVKKPAGSTKNQVHRGARAPGGPPPQPAAAAACAPSGGRPAPLALPAR